MEGAPAWGDAGVIVPWNVYLAYDDERMLETRIESMDKWVDYIDLNNPEHLWLHHRGNDYGDWLNVSDETPKEIVASAFYANSVRIVADAHKVLENDRLRQQGPQRATTGCGARSRMPLLQVHFGRRPNHGR